MIAAPPWSEIGLNYSAWTRARLAEMMAWRDGPPQGGRLVLWHGVPGTGKTTAVQALGRSWRDWAELQFITDPEEFLSNPSYLLRTIVGERRPAAGSSPVDRWRVLVLEDAGEYLAPDAKHVTGQALSRLLNVCDGVLGRATRALVLVTTNDPLCSLHPALSRPGRCLAEVEFGELCRDEVETWCAARDLKPPTANHSSLAELFAHAQGRQRRRTPSPPAIGFGAASTAASTAAVKVDGGVARGLTLGPGAYTIWRDRAQRGSRWWRSPAGGSRRPKRARIWPWRGRLRRRCFKHCRVRPSGRTRSPMDWPTC